MKRRLIALMVAGVVVGGSLTGCSNETSKDSMLNDSLVRDGSIEDVYVSVEFKDEYTLHKGDVYYVRNCGDSIMNYSIGANLTAMEFDCGETIKSNLNYIVSEEMPDEKYYDHVCEECFGNEKYGN